uniref:Uncharacterized protein n=1 Tax=Periophthalmus magnuspinnatus TaxID=409849 RepID=A0A3B3ZCH8_9GOBI
MATQAVLSERVSLAQDLLQRAESLIGAEGQVKLCNKLRSELKFLQRIQSRDMKGAHVHSSNLTQLSAVVQTAESLQSVVALLRVYTFTDELQNKRSLTVDVVADDGLLWVKSVGRKAEALHAVWQGRGQFGDRSVIGQAREFLLAASQHPLHYTRPRILFAFYNGVSGPMADELQRLGVSVSGEVVGVRGAGPEEKEPGEKKQGKEDSDLDQDSDQGSDSDPRPLTCLDRSQVVLRLAFPAPALPPPCPRVNLDVSTLLSLVSSLTHGGCGLVFQEVVLTDQAADERRAPVLPVLEAFMAGKELVACAAAERAEWLLRRVTVVPDQPSPRTLALTPSAAVSPRSVAIFGTGDTLHAVTMTANRKFVRAAANQGVHFSVFIHEPRALTEGKEWRATPVKD